MSRHFSFADVVLNLVQVKEALYWLITNTVIECSAGASVAKWLPLRPRQRSDFFDMVFGDLLVTKRLDRVSPNISCDFQCVDTCDYYYV